MKILITIGEYYFSNPFVRTLAKEMREQGLDVTCSLSEFWDNWYSYDIIHIQWPQVLKRPGMTTIEPLCELLSDIKASGKKIVVTCHNLHSHYSKSLLSNAIYETVYQNADAFVHLGDYSMKLFEGKYPFARNVLIPHHIYDSFYDINNLPSRDDALHVLGLPSDIHYVLCMGAFRDEEEINVAQKASDYLESINMKIIAPSLASINISLKHPIKSFKSYKNYKKITTSHPNIICNGKYVPDDMIPYYYAVSDYALIHRKEVLNSGNVPLALMMGKIVIGPDTGNVGPWLKSLGNPTFNPDDLSTINSAINTAIQLNNEGVGRRNQIYANSNLKTNIIAKEYIALYKVVLNQ